MRLSDSYNISKRVKMTLHHSIDAYIYIYADSDILLNNE